MIKSILLTLALTLTLVFIIVEGIEKSFINEYAQAHSINPEYIRAVDSTDECVAGERFDVDYGLCITQPDEVGLDK